MKLVHSILCFFAIAMGWAWLKTPGFLFLLDYVTGPQLPLIHIDDTGLITGMPIQLIAHVLAFIVPPEAITKILITIILLVTGISTACLNKHISQSNLIAFNCALFAMFNPFVFNRIFMGHIYLLFGYALMPFLILALFKYIQKPSRTLAMWIGGISAGIILTSIHYIVLIPIAVLFFVLEYQKNIPKKISWLHYGMIFAPSIIVCVALTLLALYTPTWTGHTLQYINNSPFSLQPYCSTSRIWDTLTLSANWKNPLVDTLPCDVTPLFMFASAGLLILAASSVSSIWIVLLYALSIALALGVSFIPGFNPMRDSGKFLANAALAQILLIANTGALIHKRLPKKIFSSVLLICVLIVAISTGTALNKSIVPGEYPQSWYTWNAEFKKQNPKPRVLFLPWHQYMAFDFTHNLAVANPAPVFFTNADIISGDNIEIARGDTFVYSVSKNPVSKKIEYVLGIDNKTEFTSQLQNLVSEQNISYILFAKSSKNEDALQKKLTSASFLQEQPSDSNLTVVKVVQKRKQ